MIVCCHQYHICLTYRLTELEKYPSSFKESLVHPTIKKKSLDPDVLLNYRPIIIISNLSFLSKSLEKLAARQINDHLTTNDLYAERQSAYRKHHES